MAGCDGWITIKIFELLFATFCMIYKRVTDDEANKLFYFLQKFSREWPLLNNVTWEENGAIFADITYGSYIIIVIGLIIGQCSGELQRCRKLENYFLIVGALLFIATGSLELAALESVEERLVDNAAILGVFTLVTGFLFIIDLLLAGKRRKRQKFKTIQKNTLSQLTQTEEEMMKGKATSLVRDMNGNIQNGQVVRTEHGHKVPQNGVKLLPSSPVLSEYVLAAGKQHPNGEYLGPMDFYPEPPDIDENDLKTHEGRIRSTESFLRWEKGLYPNLRKTPDSHVIGNGQYFVPAGYVLVPASQFPVKSAPKSDSGIGGTYTPPSYTKIVPTTKVKGKKDSDNYVVIPADKRRETSPRRSKMTSKTPTEGYYPNGRDTSSHSSHTRTYKTNSSDGSEYDEPGTSERYKHDGKPYRRHAGSGDVEGETGHRYMEPSEESSDEQRYPLRPGSRFSQRSREWHQQQQKGKTNGGYDDDDRETFSKRRSPHRSSGRTSDKPKSILRFDHGSKDVQYDSLDSQKIAQDLRTLKEIAKSDLNLARNYEEENQMLKERLRRENEEKEKLKRDLKKIKKVEKRGGIDNLDDEDEEEKNRRMSEREEQYFGLKDLKQSHLERRFEPFSKSNHPDEEMLKREIEEAGKSSREINERLKEKYLEQESKASREARELIDERFYFLNEVEKLKKRHDETSSPKSGRFATPDQPSKSMAEKSPGKQKSDSDETNYTQSTDEEIRLRVETPGSYKSEARVWVDNHRGTQATTPTTPISPASPGYVLYTAQNWPDSPSPPDRFNFNAREAQSLSIKLPQKSPLLDQFKSDFDGGPTEKRTSQKSRLLDFEEASETGKGSEMTSTRPKGLLVRKMDFPRKPVLDNATRAAVVAGSTSTWKKWLQPKPKLIPTKSAPN